MTARAIALCVLSTLALGSCLTSIGDPAEQNTAGSAGTSGVGATGGAAGWPGSGGGAAEDASAGSSGSAGFSGAAGVGGSGGAAPKVVVQQGLSSLVGVSAEASFPALDLAKSALFMGRNGQSAEPDKLLVEGALTSATTASFSRYEALGTSALVRWYVVEHENMFVQRGSLNLQSTSQVIALPTAVDPKRSFVMLSYKAAGTQMGGNDFVSAKLLAGDSFQIQAADVPSSVSWQVVELTDASRVVSKSATLAGSTTSVSVPIEPIDPSRSFLIFSYRLASNPSLTTPENVALRGEITAADSVTFARAQPGTFTIHIELSVVELAFGSVQHAPVTFPAGESSLTLKAVADPATGIAFATAYGWSGSSNFSTNDAYSEAWIAAALEPNQVTVTRGAFAQAMSANIEIVDFVN